MERLTNFTVSTKNEHGEIMGVRYTEKQLEFARKHIANHTYKEIAQRLGISHRGLRKRLSAEGVKKHSTTGTAHNKETGHERATWREYVKGYNVREISRRIKIGTGCVSRNLSLRGVYIPSRNDWNTSWSYKRELKAWKLYKKYGYEHTSKLMRCTVYELAYIFWCGRCGAKFPPEFDRRTRITRLTGILQHRIVAEYIRGLTYKELEIKFDITFVMIREALIKSGHYKTRDEFQGLNQHQKDKVISMYESGSSVKKMAAYTGQSPASLYPILREAGLRLRKRLAQTPKHLQPCELKLDDWQSYESAVRTSTRFSLRQEYARVDPDNRRGKNWHIDHRISVMSGFRRHIDPLIVGHVCNLRLIRARHNIQKGTKNSVKLSTLKQEISQYELIKSGALL
jgi:hypothetical protein